MARILSLLVVAVIVVVGYTYFFKAGGSAISAPHSAPNAVGAQNDILTIAQAERSYQVENGSYVPLDKLLSSGALGMEKPAQMKGASLFSGASGFASSNAEALVTAHGGTAA